ncbi:PP2C family protein-serine/threonine phosphatase [Thetidibacter halocola]|uniref:Serine/threonine-protein phosphatase n=1 Tax=Thetidibacter halocola TaxID=2827239 RepID=A0A8J7WC35_9RHOB|nr:protein phosphatase 2C domain-containing protein [Thetidibacter halocola]MBS0123689.1 serine/threonine-protein phosphatase [Thetidibacter halocola]
MAELIPEATALADVGRRDRQEDSVIADFSQGARLGLAVLSDGMGGHEDGDLASRVIAAEMFSELFFSGAQPDALIREAPQLFPSALEIANRRLRTHAREGVVSDGSGGTVIAVAVVNGALHWISVGDSPLYLWRDGLLLRLNEAHSMAAQIDLMVRAGALDPEEGRTHPQRHWLTSAVTGAAIQAVDCPKSALALQPGDVVILASDGLNTLPDERIGEVIRRNRDVGSQRTAQALIEAVREASAPDQDNVSVVAITLRAAEDPQPRPAPAAARPCRQGFGAVLGRLVDALRAPARSGARQARP